MQDPNSVITQAFDGCVRDVAFDLGISDKRLYVVLGDHDPYLKLWRYLTPLGHHCPDRLRLVQADFNARCERLIRGRAEHTTVAAINKETSEAVQSMLDNRPASEQRREIVEAIAELQKRLDDIDAGGTDRVLNFAS